MLKFNIELLSDDLILIDSYLPKILTCLSIISNNYNSRNLSEILNYVVQDNPLNYNQSLGINLYVYKIKRLLSESVLKVIPNILWSDSYFNAIENITVKENGLIKYYIINRKIFEENLLANAIIEAANSKLLIINLHYKSEELQFKISLLRTI